jgi:hypothetical protein
MGADCNDDREIRLAAGAIAYFSASAIAACR